MSELTQLGWDQHQFIARTMYNNFPEVFKKGGNVLAISSLSGRCVISMAAFCQELVQCNPNIEIREQSSRFTLDGVVPTDLYTSLPSINHAGMMGNIITDKEIVDRWETCKASNIQLVFYRGKKSSDEILVKCLLNGDEAKLPEPTDMFPYYKWSDFRHYYQNKINSIVK